MENKFSSEKPNIIQKNIPCSGTENHKIDEEEEESNKDTLIKKLRGELRDKSEIIKTIQELYSGSEELVKVLQEEKERLKIRVKDLGEFIQLKENEDVESSGKESDDDDNESWKTVPSRNKLNKRGKHVKSKETCIICSICGQYLITETELRAHILTCHTQDNCKDCDFQATSKTILEKHIKFKHTHKDNHGSEEYSCEDCEEVFNTKWNLQNHKRDIHKESKESCVYFKQNRCSFSAKTCWNSHEANNHDNKITEIKCFSCHMVFGTKHKMLRHRKLKHIEEIKECENFQSDECGFSDNFCYNRHSRNLSNHNLEGHSEENNISNQDFHRSSENLVPPGN